MEQTTKAPLKPQQRLFVLRTNILPALLHQLVLAEYTEGYLDSLDLMVRSKVRLWLKLRITETEAWAWCALGLLFLLQ